jgi:hypothetical protein
MSDVRYVHQHFDRPAKFGWFTPLEWGLVAVAAVVTTLWWRYLSPFAFSGTCTVAVLLNAPLYVYARLKDGRGARGLLVRLRVAWTWNTQPRSARAGRSRLARGHVIEPAGSEAERPPTSLKASPDFDALWS